MYEQSINELWLDTNLTQTQIAIKVGVTPASLSRYIQATFTEEQRKDRAARMQANAQIEARVASPSWYTGPGKSVPLRTVKYCEAYSLTRLPTGTSVVMLDGDSTNYKPENMMLLDSKEAKKLQEYRVIAEVLRET